MSHFTFTTSLDFHNTSVAKAASYYFSFLKNKKLKHKGVKMGLWLPGGWPWTQGIVTPDHGPSFCPTLVEWVLLTDLKKWNSFKPTIPVPHTLFLFFLKEKEIPYCLFYSRILLLGSSFLQDDLQVLRKWKVEPPHKNWCFPHSYHAAFKPSGCMTGIWAALTQRCIVWV